MLNYRQISPPDHLKNWVRYFWFLEETGNEKPNRILNPLADGCPGIIFQHSTDGHYVDLTKYRLPEMFLYGQTLNSSPLKLIGNFKSIGICFFPSALKSLFGLNASELTNSCLDAQYVLKDLKEPLLNSRSPEDNIKILAQRIWTLIKAKDPTTDRVAQFAISRIVESKGNIQLTQVQKELQLTERTLQRKFAENIGISPKLFARICRFQNALAQFKMAGFTNLSDVAFDNGYSDQSHFIRTFKEFAGFSPLRFQKAKAKLTLNFAIE
jgi:AraC-like DNA-binding protein